MSITTEKHAMHIINKYAYAFKSYRNLVLLFTHTSGWIKSLQPIMITIPVEPYTIVWVNPIFEKMYGSIDNFKGKRVNAIFPQFIYKLTDTFRTETFQILHKHSPSSIIHVGVTLSDFFPMGCNLKKHPHIHNQKHSALVYRFANEWPDITDRL